MGSKPRVIAQSGPRFRVIAQQSVDREDMVMLTLEGKEGADLIGVDIVIPCPDITTDLTDLLMQVAGAFLLAARTIAEEHPDNKEES